MGKCNENSFMEIEAPVKLKKKKKAFLKKK